MANRVIIAHCWDGYPDYCWYPWTKKRLEAEEFEVKVPSLPDTQLPNLKKWLPVFRETVGKPDSQTYLIGHSIGCALVMRYLESLEPGDKIGGAVLVAGFTDDLGFPEIHSFYETPLNFKKIKGNCPRFAVIYSDNDQYVDVKYAQIFKKRLGAKLIEKHGAGHFSGQELCLELPEVVNEIKSLASM